MEIGFLKVFSFNVSFEVKDNYIQTTWDGSLKQFITEKKCYIFSSGEAEKYLKLLHISQDRLKYLFVFHFSTVSLMKLSAGAPDVFLQQREEGSLKTSAF